MRNEFFSKALIAIISTAACFKPQFVIAANSEPAAIENVKEIRTDSESDNNFNDLNVTQVPNTDDGTTNSTTQATEEVKGNIKSAETSVIHNSTGPNQQSTTVITKTISKSDGKSDPQEVYTMRAHLTTPRGSYGYEVVDKLKSLLENASNNRLKLEIYPAMSLGGDPSKMTSQVKSGDLVQVIWTSAPYATDLKSLEVGTQPGIVATSARKLNLALLEYYKTIHNAPEFADMKILMLHGEAGTGFHAKSHVELKDLNSFKGLKMRISSSPMVFLFKDNLGAEPVFCTAKDLYQQLKEGGQLDGAMAPFELVKTTHSDEFLTQHIVYPTHSTVFVLAMNKKFYDQLPKDLQKVVDSVAMNTDFAVALGEMVDHNEKQAMNAMMQRSNEVFYTINANNQFVTVPIQNLKTERDKQIKLLQNGKNALSGAIKKSVDAWINEDATLKSTRKKQFNTLKNLIKAQEGK